MGGCPSPWACAAYPKAGHGYDSTNLPYSLMCHRSQKKKNATTTIDYESLLVTLDIV
jgi:hypothetical protein